MTPAAGSLPKRSPGPAGPPDVATPLSISEQATRAGAGLIDRLPPEVWEERMRRCRAEMERLEVEALLVYSAGNEVGGYEWVRYFANYVDVAPLWASETWLAIPLEGEPTLFMNWHMVVERARTFSSFTDIRCIDIWSQPEGERHDLIAPALREWLLERGLGSARVGFGHGGRGGRWMPYTPHSVYRVMEDATEGGTLVDASSLLWDITRVKTEYDLGMLRRVAEVNCEGLAAALDVLREGATESDLLAEKIRRAGALGAEIADPEHCQLAVIHAFGPRPFYVTGYRFQRGDMFVVDSGASMGGYESDIARNAIIGPPNEIQRRTYEACMEVARILEDALRPGVVARELWEIKEVEARRLGFDHLATFAGHGVGISKNESPFLAPWDNTVIEENMVVNLEPGLFVPGEACFNYEETYIVRADGPERITPLSSELFVA